MNLENWQIRFRLYLLNQRGGDHAHDIGHLDRVYQNARLIMRKTGGNKLVVLAASYFHDIVAYPPHHPKRAQASGLAAREAVRILQQEFPTFPEQYYQPVAHAIAAHSYYADIAPETLEARIVQDADRLDALGALGVARAFYTAGRSHQALFDSDDPFALGRRPDDRRYALDGVQQKLLRLRPKMQTAEGRRLAANNTSYMIEFLAKLSNELRGLPCSYDDTVLLLFTESCADAEQQARLRLSH